MAKYKCSACGANSEEEMCFRHKPRKPLKKTSFKSKCIPKGTEERDEMWEFFLEIWAERPHKSQVSGTPLYGEPLSIYFDHLLEKEIYPEYKYEKWNIALVTWEEHDLRGKGFPLARHKELIDEIRKRINDY